MRLVLLIIGLALLLVGGISYTTQERTRIGPIAIMHPIVLQDRAVSRDQFVRSNPIIAEQRAELQHPQKRSWEKEALIISGSAAAGAGIGAVAGGKKGAAIGAASGGVAGLIYDLTTRNK